jgi:hypothetical protein
MSTGPTPSQMPPAETPSGGAAPAPKKSNALLWILGGVGAFFLVCILAFSVFTMFVVHKVKQAGLDPALMKTNPGLATAKIMVVANPELELVSSNDSAGTVTIREKKTGKVMTMKFDAEKKTLVVTDESGKQASVQISGEGQNANVQVKGPEGQVNIGPGAGKVPSWVPVYPGSSPEVSYSAQNATEESGAYHFTTKDSSDKVLSYYEDALKSAGLKVSTVKTNQDGKTGGMVSGSADSDKRSVVVTVGSGTDGVDVSVIFGIKK